jgi:prevent-host-death family protein
MVRVVNMHEAKTHLSRLVDEEFIIARDGKPVARVIPIEDSETLPRFGFYPGRVEVPTDFDSMDSQEIAAMFDGI